CDCQRASLSLTVWQDARIISGREGSERGSRMEESKGGKGERGAVTVPLLPFSPTLHRTDALLPRTKHHCKLTYSLPQQVSCAPHDRQPFSIIPFTNSLSLVRVIPLISLYPS
ncbi:putative protein C16orf46 like, partial [Dissostichus eleginoides]